MDLASQAVRSVGGTISHELAIIDSVGARLTGPQREQLAAMSQIRGLFDNRSLRMASGVSTWAVRDELSAVAFDNNDGDVNWHGDWIEQDPNGPGPSGGKVRVRSGELRVTARNASGVPSAARAVDLSGVVDSASFSFDFRTHSKVDSSDSMAVEISTDGGASYSLLENITGISGATSSARSYDVSGFISADTVVRFRVGSGYSGKGEYFYADNVQIEAQTVIAPTWTIADELDVLSYSNNDGSLDWAGDWAEIGEADGPVLGYVSVYPYLGGPEQGIRIRRSNRGIEREADLSAATLATLSFDYVRDSLESSSEYVTVEVSADGGGSWAELTRIEGPGTDSSVQSVTFDVSAYRSASTRIRFVSSAAMTSTDRVFVDNIQLSGTGDDPPFDAEFVSRIGADLLHAQGTTGAGVTIAFIDSGNTTVSDAIHYNAADQWRYLAQYDAMTDTLDDTLGPGAPPADTDVYGHASHLISTALRRS